jgi:hypothetical protein
MKKIILPIAMVCGLISASCNKTYECKDERTGIVVGEVGARSQAKADELCDANSSDPASTTAKRK